MNIDRIQDLPACPETQRDLRVVHDAVRSPQHPGHFV
jgi:hypothetical protein